MVLASLPHRAASILAQQEVDAWPRLPAPAFACVLALVGVLWLMARVHAERRAQAEGHGPRTGIAVVRRLAAWPPAYPVLGVLALVLGAATWLLR